MKRYVIHMMIFCCLSALSGCGSTNPEAPSAGDVHPDAWLALHGAEANEDLRGCQGCHGFDYQGSDDAVSCFSCHVSGPPFALHPAEWDEVVVDHQGFASAYSWTGCAVALCHGADLRGGNGPSCLNGACHTETVNPVPTSHRGVAFTDPVNHGQVARANQVVCLNCHGRPPNSVDGGFISDPSIMNNLDHDGGSVVGSCVTCHPDAGAHPTNWQGGNDQDLTYAASHRGVDLETQSQSCGLCHNVDGPGSGPVPDAPSCFTTEHTNANGLTTGCHPNGPRTAPHPIDGSYRPASEHGKDAKLDLTACQSCHADNAITTPGSNPRFNAPIGDLVDGCETCHASYYAHPSDWAGPNNTFHYSAGNVTTACALCHGSALDGVGGVNASGGTPGQSCLNCHDDVTAFTLDCSACHGYPPDGSVEPQIGGTPVDHGGVSVGSAGSSHETCLVCHGVNATDSGSGDFSPAAEYAVFDPVTDTPGEHWNGALNMNGPTGNGTGYNQTNFGCDNAACHPNDDDHQLSGSTLTLAFGDYGTGSAPHPVDGVTYLDGAVHGPDAKADLAGCKACHGESTNVNPRFNVGIASAGGNGCESCHNDFTAHPSTGGRDDTNWYDVDWRHATGSISAATCGMCHPGLGGSGTVGPACTECHVSDPSNAAVGSCTSCHGTRPDGSTQPNRAGEHSSRGAHRRTCTDCHTNAGPGDAAHFTRPNPDCSRANLRSSVLGTSMIMTITPTNVTCSGNCHGSEPWYE